MKLTQIVKSINNIENAYDLILENEIENMVQLELLMDMINENEAVSKELQAHVTIDCQSKSKHSLLISGAALTTFPKDKIKTKVADNLKAWLKNGHFDDIGAGKCLDSILALLHARLDPKKDKHIIDDFESVTTLIKAKHDSAKKEIQKKSAIEREKRDREKLEKELAALHDTNCCSLEIASTPVKKMFDEFEKTFTDKVIVALDKVYDNYKDIDDDSKNNKKFNLLLKKLKFLMKKLPFTESLENDNLDLLIETLSIMETLNALVDEDLLNEGKTNCHTCITPQNLKYLVASKKTLNEIKNYIEELQMKVISKSAGLTSAFRRKKLTKTEHIMKQKTIDKVQSVLVKAEKNIRDFLKKIINVEQSYNHK